jgi:signal transduction histidine kinase
MSNDDQNLFDHAGERLQELADPLVDRWISWVRTRINNPAVETLPERALRNHIPPVIDSLGQYLANPSLAIRSEMLNHLRLHAQMRRDQGYDVQDLLAEFDGLSHLIVSTLQREVVARWNDNSMNDILTLFARLTTGLRAIAFVTVGVFERSEDERRHEMARKLSEFAHTISHELRTPVQSARLGALMLLQDQVDDDRHARARQAEMIQAAMDRIEGLLEDIDLLAMTEAAQMQARMGALPGLLEAIREELIARAKARDVRLEFADSLPRVAVERVVAQLALANVIGNAIKYADPQKQERWVRVSASVRQQEDTPFVSLVVEDNGLGIPEEYRSRVFQRGFRAHPETAEGTGLGLTITQELVLERGGAIDLKSEEGRGTRVTITLRATDAESGKASATTQPEDLMRQSIGALLDSNPEDLDPESNG